MYYGPYLVYYVNESKSWLVIKEKYIEIANETFRDYNIKITTDGHRHLGAAVGSNENKEEFVMTKVSEWVKQLQILTNFACTEPYAAFTGLIHGLRHRYTYFMRTIPGISHLLKPLDDAINAFIKVLLQGYALPAKYGGMRLMIPSEICQEKYENSREITKKTTNKVIRNEIQFQDNRVSTEKIKNNIKKLQEITNNTSCKTKLIPVKQRSIEASTKNGASIWLTVILIKKNGFFQEKQTFWDAIRIRYNILWNIYQYYVLVETRLICNMLYLVRKED